MRAMLKCIPVFCARAATNLMVSCSLLVFMQKITFTVTKIHKNCFNQSCCFWLRYQPNRLAAGASPQTPLGELTALPQTPNCI